MTCRLKNKFLDVPRRFVVRQQRYLSNSSEVNSVPTAAGATIPTLQSPPAAIRFVSRRLFEQYQQHVKSSKASKNATGSNVDTKNKVKVDETPWPRNIVLGTYAALSFCIPYSIAWFLSSNQPLRTMIFPPNNDDTSSPSSSVSSIVLEWMRSHFGVIDHEAISEPEQLSLSVRHQPIPYRFVDEPTKRIRHEQFMIDQQQKRNVTLRVMYAGGMEANEKNVSVVTQLPATTWARFDDLHEALLPKVSITPPIALDFIDYDDDNNDVAEAPLSDDTITSGPPVSMSIYSLWHYQAPKPTDIDSRSKSSSINPFSTMSTIDIELSRIQYEMDLLRQELQSSSSMMRPIDDIQEEIKKLQALKRRVQWRKWLSF